MTRGPRGPRGARGDARSPGEVAAEVSHGAARCRWAPVRIPQILGPRDGPAAGRTAAVMCLAGALATVTLETLPRLLGSDLGSVTSLAWTVVGTLVMVGLALVLHRRPEVVPGPAYTVLCLLAITVNTTVSNLTDNSTFGGLAWFMFAVIFAAAHLRPAVAWTIAVLTLLGASSIIVTTQSPEAAAADTASMVAIVLMTTTALLTAGRHQDRLVHRLHEVASTDGLTGLATRRVLEEAAELLRVPPRGASERRAGELPAGAGLVLVDLDRFKALNDTYGHPVGDAALAHCARLVRSVVRSSDTVARLGGDELAILLPGGRAAVVERARAVHAIIRDTPLAGPTGPLGITVSVGVAHVLELEGLDHLYTVADAALYEAKSAGRDRVVVRDADPRHGPEDAAPEQVSSR